jgi:uncharacterized protein
VDGWSTPDSASGGEAVFDYSGSTALVTGASKGLGAAFAEALAQRGMNLVLVARSTHELNVLSKRLDSKYKIQSTVLSIDLANPNSPQTIAEELEVAAFKWIFW